MRASLLYTFVLFVLAGFILFPGPASGQTYLSEDFSSGQMPPNGWEIENVMGQWSVSSTALAGGTAPEAMFSYVQQITTTRLISPEVNLSGVSTIFFQFRHMYDHYLGDGPAMGIATRSGGGEWNSVWETEPDANAGPETITLEISNEDVGEDDFQVCCYLSGDLYSMDFWYLDDIHLYMPIKLHVDILLEGPYLAGQMSNVLNGLGYLPLSQPYDQHPWYYPGDESVGSIPSAAITDWVLLELWKKNQDAQPQFTVEARQAGFILQNGRVTGLDGVSPMEFHVNDPDSLYLWIHHRNHLSVLSSMTLAEMGDVQSYNFSLESSRAIHGMYAMKQTDSGKWSVLSGDGNGDGQINNQDKYEVWYEQQGSTGYYSGDFNLDGVVDSTDLQLFWEPNSGSAQWVPDTAQIQFAFNCGDTLFDSRDGNTYQTVQIGSQCWMSENLNYETGTSWCYNYNAGNCELYGRLYSWYTIMNGSASSFSVPSGVQGICPEGFHVPSDPEYCILTMFIDASVNCDTTGYNGTDVGMKMKSTTGWSTNGNGTNESGFNALPSGCMGIYHFDDLLLFSYHWSASEDYPGFALLMKLNYGLPTVGRYFSLKDRGYSLRCLKD